jgi:uncharacterized protein
VERLEPDGLEAAIPGALTRPWRVEPGASARGRAFWQTRVWAAVLLLSVAVILVDAVVVEPSWIETVRSIEYVAGLPARAPDLTLVHISDPHIVQIGLRERRAIDLINDARPDLIVLSGDLTREGSRPADLEKFLGALRSRYGTYAVWGNHDYWDRAAITWGPETLRRSGVTLLRNGNVRLPWPGGRVVIAGVDDPVTGRDNLKEAMHGVPREDVCILISHSPEIAPSLGNWDIDLVMAGHTHGGQIRLPGIGALYVPPGTRDFVEGWFNVQGGARLHVSQGLGWSYLPVRFFCRPRIDVITLRGGRPPGLRVTRSILGRS